MLINTSAKIGEDPTDETIRIGTVRMKEHPNFEELETFLSVRGVVIEEIEDVTNDVGYIERIVLNAANQKIRTGKILTWHPEMRFLDLEHEIDHIKQFEENLKGNYCTHLVQEKSQGPKTIEDSNLGWLNKPQKAFLEYEVRIREILRLKERGASKTLLDEHIEGLQEAHNDLSDGTVKFRGSKRTKFYSWQNKHFPDFEYFDFKNFIY